MSTINLSDFKTLFITTSQEQIGKLADGLHRLEVNPSDQEARDLVYINAHTLASKNSMMGYETTGSLCKTIELIFYAIKNGSLVLTSNLVVQLVRAGNKIDASLHNIGENNQELDLSSEQKALQEATNIKEDIL